MQKLATTITKKIQDLLRKEGLLLLWIKWIESNPSKEYNWREESNDISNTKTTTNREIEKKRRSTQSHNTGGILKEGEKRDLLIIVVPYPNRYSTYAIPMDGQHLYQPRKKSKVCCYYYHSYGYYRTLFITPDIEYWYRYHHEWIITNRRHTVIRVPSHPYQHDTIT